MLRANIGPMATLKSTLCLIARTLLIYLLHASSYHTRMQLLKSSKKSLYLRHNMVQAVQSSVNISSRSENEVLGRYGHWPERSIYEYV